jgi:transcriptional regulator with XRE-family HTH domain
MKPHGAAWRHGRARLDLSAKEAAERLRIAHRYLLNIESNQPGRSISLRLAYRAAALYGVPYDELVAEDDDQKDPPAKDPKREEREPDPSGPPTRPDRDRKGPPRSDLAAAS